MSSIFTKIVNKEIPCYKVAEDENCIAFLDINPNAKGHTLCVPKIEVDKLFDLNEDTYIQLMKFSRKIAKALEKTVSCKRVGVSVIGLEVPHAHIHLIPINEIGDISFQKEKLQLSPTKMQEIANSISEAFSQL